MYFSAIRPILSDRVTFFDVYICIKIFVHEYSYIAPSVAIISSLGKQFPHSAGKLGSVDYSFFKPIQKINGETV